MSNVHERSPASPPHGHAGSYATAQPDGDANEFEGVSRRVMWWQWIKAYGLFAPAVALTLLRDWLGAPLNVVGLVVLGAVGYLFAVRWLLATQGGARPMALGPTVAGFLLLHALLVGGLGWMIWFLAKAAAGI